MMTARQRLLTKLRLRLGRTCPSSLFVVREFKILYQLRVHFPIQLWVRSDQRRVGLHAILYTLVGTHVHQLVAVGSTFALHSVHWRRHQISETIVIFLGHAGSQVTLHARLLRQFTRLRIHSLPDKLHELAGLYVLEGVLLALGKEPDEYLLECILFALLVS